MNKVESIGRLTKEVRAFASENGNSVARYSLAVLRNMSSVKREIVMVVEPAFRLISVRKIQGFAFMKF